MRNAIAERDDFNIAVAMFARAWNQPTNVVTEAFRPTKTRLRLEQRAVTTSNQYKFQVLVNQTNPFPTEIRLNLQDVVVVTAMGFYLANPTGDTDTAFSLFTYANPFVFGASAGPMGSLYNGNFSIMLQNDQYIVNWPSMWHKNVPQTQQTTNPGVGAPLDQFVGDDYGMSPMQPFLLLNGAQNIDITLNIPSAPSSVLANSRLVVVFDGILFQNCTNVR